MLDKLTDFLRVFFGPGNENYHFKYFSLSHIIPILIMVIIIILLYRYRKEIRANEKLDLKLRFWLGFLISIANISWYWLFINIGTDPSVALPLTICETVMFFSPFLLLTKSQKLFDVFYFWTLCGSTNALLTPAVLDNYGPTTYRYYQFWIGHAGIMVVIFYCLFILKMNVTFKSLLRSIFWLFLMSLLAMYVNSVIPNANYLFLKGSEAGSSVLDLLPTYLPVRFAILFVLVIILFSLAYLPWYFINRKTIKEG